MVDGIHYDFVWIDFVYYLVRKSFNQGATHSAENDRIHLGILLDGLNAPIYAPEKIVSQEFTLSVIPPDGFFHILLGFES